MNQANVGIKRKMQNLNTLYAEKLIILVFLGGNLGDFLKSEKELNEG